MEKKLDGKMVNIIHIISGDIWAGAEAQVYHTVAELSRQSHIEVTCIVFNNGLLKKKLEKKSIRTIILDESENSNLSLLLMLKNVIKQESPDLLHVHAVKEHFSGKLASWLCRRKIPIVRTVHGTRKVPINLPPVKSFRSNAVVFLDNYLINKGSDAVIAVSMDLEHELNKNNHRGNVSQIYNAIDASEYDFEFDKKSMRRRFKADGVFWIGTAARLVEPKNLKMLIKAGNYLNKKGVKFLISIFGEGPLKDDLQKLINHYSLSKKIILHGFEPDIIPLIYALDVFVLCSFHEGLPMALLESMYLKTPVVCTAVGGINEVIENNVNGLLVTSDDAKALADAVNFLHEEKSMSASLTTNARSTIDNKFLLSQTSKQLNDLYFNILHGV